MSTKKLAELVKEIMEAGVFAAMGGDAFMSEEGNKAVRDKEYDQAINKYVQAISQVREEAKAEGAEELADFVLTNGHGGGNWRRLLIQKAGRVVTSKQEGYKPIEAKKALEEAPENIKKEQL